MWRNEKEKTGGDKIIFHNVTNKHSFGEHKRLLTDHKTFEW